jgi:hypothetical protein
LQDLSVTSVDLAEQAANAQGDEHLYVTVSRTDDLVDDDGSLLAERVMTVQVTFDVVDTQLHCNGVPVEIGVSNIQVEAQIASNPDKLTVASEEEAALLEDSFDIGLATVEVTAAILDELKTEDGMTVRRLSVQEKIVEINGEQVVQTEAGQQIIDIFEDGKVQKWAVDPMTGFLLPGPAMAENEQPLINDASPFVPDQTTPMGCGNRLAAWWKEQSPLTHGMITGGFCAVLFAIALAIRQLIVSAASSSTEYQAVPVAEKADEVIYQEKEEEKRPFLS